MTGALSVTPHISLQLINYPEESLSESSKTEIMLVSSASGEEESHDLPMIYHYFRCMGLKRDECVAMTVQFGRECLS